MPIIEFNLKDLEKFINKKLPRDADKLTEFFQYVGGETEALDGDNIQLEIKCRNRPDLWSVEGIARELRGVLGKERGLAKYKAEASKFVVNVDKNLKDKRPFIACAVVKDIKLSDEVIRQIMQQQDKVDGTYGRKRRKTSIGLYDFDLIKFPLTYKAVKPRGIEFVPLDFKVKMTPSEILEEHPKGKEYAHLLEGMKEYPLFVDSKGRVLSMPPIINSNDLGKLTNKTKNVLIEVTGTDYEAVQNVLIMIALTLVDRGGKLYSVKINYPYRKKEVTPIFQERNWRLNVYDVNKRLGLDLSGKQVASLLEKGRYGIKKISDKYLDVYLPVYRTDILHSIDLIEDIAIMYGYDKFQPEDLDVLSIGKLDRLTEFSDKIRELMLGLSAQEVMTFTLTDKEILTKKILVKNEKLIELINPISSSYAVVRDEIWPGLLDFLSKNTKVEYPQRIFEVGSTVISNTRAETNSDTIQKTCFVDANKSTNFTEARQALDFLLNSIGYYNIEIREIDHDSFIPGRVGRIYVDNKNIGVIGEIHPQVLNNFRIEVPVVLFEINLNALMGSK